MPQVRFEPTIPVFERAKAVHALDRAATVIGLSSFYLLPEMYFQTAFMNISDILNLKGKYSVFSWPMPWAHLPLRSHKKIYMTRRVRFRLKIFRRKAYSILKSLNKLHYPRYSLISFVNYIKKIYIFAKTFSSLFGSRIYWFDATTDSYNI
jgi:hypothetical protein